MRCQPLSLFKGARSEFYDYKNPKRYKLMPDIKKSAHGSLNLANGKSSELCIYRRLVLKFKPKSSDMATTEQRRLEIRV